jgi:PAS domain S-box-containing protein
MHWTDRGLESVAVAAGGAGRLASGATPDWRLVQVLSDVAIAVACITLLTAVVRYLRKWRAVPPISQNWLVPAFLGIVAFRAVLAAITVIRPELVFVAGATFILAVLCWTILVFLVRNVRVASGALAPSECEDAVQDRTQALQAINSRLKSEVARRERIEHALREREEQLRLVLEAGRMGTWEWDLKRNVLKMDAREQRLFGVDLDDGRMAIHQMFAAIHPDDLPRIQEAADRSIQTRARFEQEFRLRQPDGKLVWLAARGDVIRDEQDQASRMIGVHFEVTEQRKADEQLLLRDRALQSATNGIVICDALNPELPIIYVNHAFEQLTGYKGEEILGHNCRFLQGLDTDPKAVQVIRDAIHEQIDCRVTLKNYKKDGSSFWNELQITPLRNDMGEVTHFVGIEEDVTSRHEFEETLKRAEALAQAASQAKSEFLANMSHEIRTPLTTVLGCADTLYPRLDREEHRDMLQMIRNQGRMLLGILNDVLDLSKIEAGRLEIHVESSSIVAVIEDVKALFEQMASEKGIELKTHYDHQMPSRVETDPLRVRQILMNLVGNAIKFTERGEVTIAAYTDIEHDPPKLLIDVRDTGIGIPHDRLEAVFEAFSQVTATPSRKAGGTGLGLTISQRLVKMLHGEITVASRMGRGTIFTVSLPLSGAAALQFELAEGLALQADEQNRSRDSIDLLQPVTVLVAEDTRGIQFMIRRMLEDAGAMVFVVENGDRAVTEVLRAQRDGQPYDLVLMDMQMPVLNGFEATARLRALGCRLPIIALTAAAMLGDREKCLNAGCDDYLSKPIDRHALLDAIARQYNRAAAMDGSAART